VMPAVVMVFLCVVFYLLGGGRGGVRPIGAAAMGLNTQLPKPKFDPRQAFLDKMKAYAEADRDSMRRAQYERQDPYRKVDTIGARKYGGSSVTGRRGYGGRGSSRSGGDGAPVPAGDQKADELLRQLDQLQRSIHQPAGSRRSTEVQNDREWAGPRVTERVAGLGEEAVADPKMEELNSMLDKVIRIQHPEEAKVLATPAMRRLSDEVVPADSGVNTISAMVPEDEVLTAGSTLALRITDPIRVNGRVLPAGQLVYGTVTIQNDRLSMHIGSLRDDRNLYSTELEVYDLDGLAGIHIPGMLGRDVAKQSADQGVSSLNVLNMDPSLAAQAAAAGIQTVKSFVGHKVRQVRVSVRAGYRVLLRPARPDGAMHGGKSVDSEKKRPPGFVPGGPIIERCRSEGMELSLRAICLEDSCLWFGLEWMNRSPIPYAPAYSRWYVRDRRVFRRTAMQEWQLTPLAAPDVGDLGGDSVRYGWFGFRPFILAKDKELVVEVGEKGGGRVLQLVIDHRELLKAKNYGRETEP